MRPLELTLRGFQSYAAEQTFDFRDRRLLGIVGPIGSGKSSLLDGIAFALYGKTPRAGRGTRDLINQRGAAAHVELWFDVEGETWRAVRALRRKGQSAHNLYRHESADAESERLEEVTGERAMTARVEELLGLDFDAFNRSVFLAQNRFAEFLQATAAQRDAVLKGVFGFDRLDRMAQVAKDRRDALKAELADLERLRVDVEKDRATLEALQPAVEQAAARVTALDGASKQAAGLEAALESAARDAEHAGRRAAELADVAAQLPARDRSAEVLTRATTGAELLTAAEEALVAAAGDVEAALRHEAEAVEQTGGREGIAEAARLLDRSADLASRRQSLSSARDDAQVKHDRAVADHKAALAAQRALEKAETKATSDLAKAVAAIEAAEDALHRARHDDMALTLRKELSAGDSCPVCAQEVASVPAAGKAAALDRAEKKLADARAAHVGAQKAHTAATAELAASRAEVKSGEAAVAAALERVTATEGELATVAAEQEALEASITKALPVDDPAAELGRRRRLVEEAVALVESKRAAESAARAALDEVRRSHQQLEHELVQLATTVATLAGQLGGDLRPGADAGELADSLETLRKLWEEASLEVTKAREVAEQQAEAAGAELRELRRSLDIPEDVTIGDARQHAGAEHARLAERAETLAGRVERFEALEAGSAETVARLHTFEILADDLLPSRFLKFILDEERRALAELGSEHFERMTRGRYRFTDDGEFNIADLTAAEAVRKAESLSGGETFLASLSLALALAEMVSRTGGRLDAFFLDEGFGSLDPEHLDLAMEGIEALVGGNRLVAVVSHVAELRERVEDLIVLDTNSVTGDTVVVRA